MAEQVKQEAAGPVASDSLAADSYRADGGFTENRDAAPSSVRGADSTFANTDISGARVLHAATDREAREGDEEGDGEGSGGKESGSGSGSGRQGRDEERGEVEDEGAKVQEYGGQIGGSGSTSQDRDENGSGDIKDDEYEGTNKSKGSGEESNAGNEYTTDSGPTEDSGLDPSSDQTEESRETAPSYVETVTGGFRPASDFVPKGQGLKEGGFDGDEAKNASFEAEVGTEDDPSREAEKAFRKDDARIPGVVAGGEQDEQGEGQGGYQSLKGDEPV